MQPVDDARLKQAIQARDRLAERYLHLPGVNVIDIGYATDNPDSTGSLVIRIHVKDVATLKTLDLPKQDGGIPIQVMISDYKLEA